MANLNSPSSRVVKDSTPFRRRILRCKNFRKGESWPSLFLDVVNLYLIKFRHRWILNERTFYSFIILFIWKWILTENKWISLVNLYLTLFSRWWILTQCFWKEVNWWRILTLRFCWKGEQRWRLEVGRFKMAFDACINCYIVLYNVELM